MKPLDPVEGPGVRSTRVLSRALAVAGLLLMLLIGFGLSRYVTISDRLDRASAAQRAQTTAIRNLSRTVRDQADALSSVEELATQFARLASADPTERAAAREELHRIADELERRRQQRAVASSTTSQPARSSVTPSTTTTTRRPTTSTTRPCLNAIVATVCRTGGT